MVFFPADQAVPQTLRTPTFVLRQLRQAEAAIDYEAYMTSPDVIHRYSGGCWQVDGFTLAQEQHELALHERRHHARQDFAFILLTPDETKGLGCVYVLPLMPFLRHFAAPPALLAEASDATAIITFWVRQDCRHTDLAPQVVAAVHSWLLSEWPFDDHVFRVNPAERESIQALEQCGFQVRFELTMDEPPITICYMASLRDKRTCRAEICEGTTDHRPPETVFIWRCAVAARRLMSLPSLLAPGVPQNRQASAHGIAQVILTAGSYDTGPHCRCCGFECAALDGVTVLAGM